MAAHMTEQVSARRRREIAGVDLLRFAAAFMVMCFHLGFWGCAAPHSRTNSLLDAHVCFPGFAPFASMGWVGVEIFFVISGFVIAWSAQEVSARAFVRSRFLRLAPAAWICATITACVVLAFTSANLRDLIRPYWHTLVFFPTPPWIDDAYWTLDVEIAFYAVVASLLACGRRRWIMPVIGAIGAASAFFWVFRAAVGASGFVSLTSLLDEAAGSRYSELTLIQHGCFFCIGVILCESMAGRLSREIVALALFCSAGAALEIAASALRKSAMTGFAQSAAAPIAIWALAMLVIVLSIRFAGASARGPKADRTANWARRVGLMTYPLYLLHTLIGSVALQIFVRAGLSDGVSLALAMAVAVALAFLVSEFFEPALRRMLARRLYVRAAPRGAGSVPAVTYGDAA